MSRHHSWAMTMAKDISDRDKIIKDRLHFQDLLDHFNANDSKFTAPYGIIEGTGETKNGKKYKSITFGVARYLDAHVMYFSPKFIIVNGEGALAHKIEGKYGSIEGLKTAINNF